VNGLAGKEAMKTVLFIDDNEDFRETVRYLLEAEGLEVYDSDCPDSAFGLLSTIEAPDLIVCDLHMPFTTDETKADEYVTSFEVGVKTVHELAWVYPDTPVVAMTGLQEVDIQRIKRYLSPIPTYQKPERLHEFLDIVRCHLVSQDWGGIQ
jgi:CheY-like chemotaxis protein